jgi:hypothetical protein
LSERPAVSAAVTLKLTTTNDEYCHGRLILKSLILAYEKRAKSYCEKWGGGHEETPGMAQD